MATEAQILSREMAHAYLSGITITNRLFSLICQRIMTFLCKTKPISEKPK
jgi:hypothetical protein